MQIIENLMHTRMRTRRYRSLNRNLIGSVNSSMINYEHDRAVQEAILESITRANDSNSDDDID